MGKALCPCAGDSPAAGTVQDWSLDSDQVQQMLQPFSVLSLLNPSRDYIWIGENSSGLPNSVRHRYSAKLLVSDGL